MPATSCTPRTGVSVAFLVHATVSGTWAPRLPAIKQSLELSDGELATALVGLALGLLAGTRLAGAPVDRYGSRSVMRVGFPALGAVLVLPAIAGGAVTLFGALLALGVLSGLLDVAMNAQGIEVERRLERPVLPAYTASGASGSCAAERCSRAPRGPRAGWGDRLLRPARSRPRARSCRSRSAPQRSSIPPLRAGSSAASRPRATSARSRAR
jgi:MFS family permease